MNETKHLLLDGNKRSNKELLLDGNMRSNKELLLDGNNCFEDRQA
jgi:hypothetical protein